MSLQTNQASTSIILTGDRPTGPLHLGHYVGSLRNRVAMASPGSSTAEAATVGESRPAATVVRGYHRGMHAASKPGIPGTSDPRNQAVWAWLRA